MDFKELLLEDLSIALKKCKFSADNAVISQSNKPELADYQTNVAFALAKQAQLVPMVVAQKIVENLPETDLYEVSVAAPAFINFKLTDKCINKYANYCLKDKTVGLKKLENPRKVFLDYGGANVAKELHIGHLRSPIIGEALARLHKLLGDKVITDVYLGDWGTQMGLTIAQLEDDGILEGYFGRSNVKQEITMDMLNVAYPKASKRKNVEPEFRKRADQYTYNLQQHIEPYYTIYNKIRETSLVRIKHNYNVLGCNFDLWNGESTAQPFVKPTIEIFKKKGLAQISDGALIVDVSEEGENVPSGKFDENGKELLKNPMPPVMLQKANGADIYDTTEIATVNMRYQAYKPDEFIYITDKRQSQHFVIAFRAVKKAGLVGEDTKLSHVGFGTMNGTDGKPFKTRSGDTIKLEDIIDLVTEAAQKKLAENGIVGDRELALNIGLAAAKFGDLSFVCNRDYVFDLDKFTSFEGKTGPYVQYTGTRIKSLLSKANENGRDIEIYDADQRELVINLAKLNDAYYASYNEYSLNTLCLALYNFCSTFSRFYNNTKILTEPDKTKKQSYISLCKLALRAIEQATNTLGFVVPERM